MRTRFLHSLFAAVLLLSTQARGEGPDELTILETPDPKVRKSILDYLDEGAIKARNFYQSGVRSGKNAIDGFDAQTKVDLLKFEHLHLSTRISIRDADKMQTLHDLDMTYATDPVHPRRFVDISAAVETAIPLYVGIPTGISGIGVDAGMEFGAKKEILLRIPNAEPLNQSSSLLKTALSKVVRDYQALRSVRIPIHARPFFDRYGSGASLVQSGYHRFLVSIGASLGAAGFSVGASYQARVQGDFQSVMENLWSPGRRLVHRYLRSVDSTSRGAGVHAGFGISLFKTEHLDAQLRVDLLSTSYEKARSNELAYDYTYDLDYPEAEAALNAAIAGDLTPSQALAVSREQVEGNGASSVFRGVLLNFEESGVIRDVLHRYSVGLKPDASSIGGGIYGIHQNWRPGTRFLRPIYFEGSSDSRESGQRFDAFYDEDASIDDFAFNHYRRSELGFCLLTCHQTSVDLHSRIIQTRVNFEGEGVQIERENKFSVSLQKEERIRGRKLAALHADSLFRALGLDARESVADACRDRTVSTRIDLTLYDRAMERMRALDEKEVWVIAGRIAGLEVPARLRYDQTRKEAITSVGSREFRNFLRSIPALVLAPLAKLRASASREETARGMREMVREFGKSSLPYELLIQMATGDLGGSDSASDRYAGSMVRYSIESPHCHYAWTRTGDVVFRMSDIMRDWAGSPGH